MITLALAIPNDQADAWVKELDGLRTRLVGRLSKGQLSAREEDAVTQALAVTGQVIGEVRRQRGLVGL